MSYRPTISVLIDGRVVDFGYYKNWNEESLFYEAIVIAALFHKCTTFEEYYYTKNGFIDYSSKDYLGDYYVYEHVEETWDWLSHSENPICIDLTAKCIYTSHRAKSISELAELPSAFSASKITSKNISNILHCCRIPFDQLNMEQILIWFIKSDELRKHLSGTTAKILDSRLNNDDSVSAE